MAEYWRELLYPLGFLSSLAFGSRFLLQWLQSEKKKESFVTPSFWRLSLVGNILLWIHSLIQLQFHVCFIQACNGVISWRNLNLMQPQKVKTRTVVGLLVGAVLATVLIFFALSANALSWFRVPTSTWFTGNTVSLFWHCFGFLGLALFSSRFWVQWWLAEKHQASFLGSSFWWISLVGDLMTLTYFIQIYDPVNIVGPALGLIPYVRNLMLIHKTAKKDVR